MENNFDEPFDALVDLINTLIDDAPERLAFCISRGNPDIYISIPSFLIKRLQEAMVRKYNYPRTDHIFMGIKIVPSSDYALTLFHEDYVIFKEDWMIHKISLDPLFVSKQSANITKYVGQIKGFIPERMGKDSSLN